MSLPRRRLLRALGLVLPIALPIALPTGLLGCAGVGGPPTIVFSEREIERLVSERFPIERRLLEVFDVTLATPRVRLLPDRRRLAAALEMRANEHVFGGRWNGRLDFDAELRWEPRDRSVRLSQVRVQDFALDSGGGSAARSGAERLAGALVERVIDEMPIYTLPAERLDEMRRRGYAPAAATVTSRGVEITFDRVTP